MELQCPKINEELEGLTCALIYTAVMILQVHSLCWCEEDRQEDRSFQLLAWAPCHIAHNLVLTLLPLTPPL